MKNITITEQYALFVVKEKKKLFHGDYLPYLCVSILIEMEVDGNLVITDKKKIQLTDKMPKNTYSKQVYDLIKEQKKEISFKNFISNVCFGFSSKKSKSIIYLLRDDMISNGLITTEEKKRLIGNKEVIVLNDDKFNNLINNFRKEFLEKGILTDDTVLLASLLNASNFIKKVFTKYEIDIMKKRLKEIKDSDISKSVKIAQDIIDEMLAAIVVIMAASVTTTSN